MPPKKIVKPVVKKTATKVVKKVKKMISKVSPERMNNRMETLSDMEYELRTREIKYQEEHINRLQKILDEKKQLLK